METLKQNRGRVFGALLSFLAGCALTLVLFAAHGLPAAQAQSGSTLGYGGSGQNGCDIYSTVTGSGTGGLTFAQAPTGYGSGKCILRSLVIQSSASGVVIIKDCPPATAPLVGTTVANIGVIANTPMILDDRFFGGGIGMICSETNGSFSATLSGATLAVSSRFSIQ